MLQYLTISVLSRIPCSPGIGRRSRKSHDKFGERPKFWRATNSVSQGNFGADKQLNVLVQFLKAKFSKVTDFQNRNFRSPSLANHQASLHFHKCTPISAINSLASQSRNHRSRHPSQSPAHLARRMLRPGPSAQPRRRSLPLRLRLRLRLRVELSRGHKSLRQCPLLVF
jgi:hypothetical protein